MALLLVPENGQPLNQLGTLFGSENYGIDAAYYYIYCLSCSIPFNGAKENLKLLFSKNRKRYAEIKSLDESKHSNYQLKDIHSKEIKKFLVLFLHIIDQFLMNYLDNSTTLNTNNLQELCQICLQEFNACMFYKSFETNNTASTKNSKTKWKGTTNLNEKLAYLPNDLIFKLAIMILMTIERLKKAKFVKINTSSAYNKEMANTILFTAIAFAFIFFSHIINHSILRFQEDIFNLKKPSLKTEVVVNHDDNIETATTITNDENHTSEDNLNSDDTKVSSSLHKIDSNENSDSSNFSGKKKKIHLIFGRRRRQRNSDSDTNSEDSDNESYGFLRQKKRNNNREYAKHEYLSEDELNELSTEEEEDENDVAENKCKDRTLSSSSSLSPGISKSEINSEEVQKKHNVPDDETKNNEMLQNYITKEIPLMDAQKSNISANFKEFSTQLFTNFSLFESKFENFASVFQENNEIIDNEIYKGVLNGQKQVSVPPGFESNPKEAQEIEELGKKLATFQIETDTEISIFNSDTNVNSSSDDSSISGEESESSILKAPSKQLENHPYL